MKNAEFKIVIPARFGSSRFPGKALALIHGKPMIWHVYQRAIESAANEVVIATDDVRISDMAKKFAANVCVTDLECESGTDRIAQVCVSKGWPDETVIVNLQGDEPLTPASLIRQVANNLSADKRAGIATLCSEIRSQQDFLDPNIVKVVFDREGYALYFSRAPIPWPREGGDHHSSHCYAYRHIGLYAYRAGFLKSWSAMPVSNLENIEKLEQLRAMNNGVLIHVAKAHTAPPHGVDTPEQLVEIERLMNKN